VSAVPRTSFYTEVDAAHMQRAFMEAQQAFDRGEVTTYTLLTVDVNSMIKKADLLCAMLTGSDWSCGGRQQRNSAGQRRQCSRSTA
jgi:hypothetical protein